MMRANQRSEHPPLDREVAGCTRRQLLLGVPGAVAGLVTLGPLVPRKEGRDRPLSERFLAAVIAGDLSKVKQLLDLDPALVTTTDDAGRSAFVLALLNHHPPIAELLRDRGYQPDLHESALALDWERMDSLADEAPGAVNRNHPIGGTVFYAAALAGAGSDVFRLYSYAGDPNLVPPDSSGISPLRVALEYPDLTTAEITAAGLLGNGADPNAPQVDSVTPLHVAAERGSVELTEMLIRKRAEPAARDREGRTPLDRAIRHHQKRTAGLLRRHHEIPRDHSTSRRAYDVDGNPYQAPDLTAFSPIAKSDVVGLSHFNFEAVRARVDRNPQLAHSVATTTEGAVEACAHTGRHEIVEYLLDKGAPYSLPTAVMSGDLTRARELLAEDPLRVHERGPHDFALMWYPSIGGGLLEMAELLVESGAEIERQHYLGTTALHFAAHSGQVEMVEWLIDRGADVNRIGRKFDPKGQSPLQLAQQRERDEVARLLVDHGARE